MKCPICTETQLIMTERSGIEIDYCPQCRGVWLDRGELDKIIERSQREFAPEPSQQAPISYPAHRSNCDKAQGFGRGSHQQGRHGFFKDLFD